MTDIYTYPTDIREERYKHRSVQFTVKKSELVDDAFNAFDDALRRVNEKLDRQKIEAKDPITQKAILETNKKKENVLTVGSIILPLPNAFNDSQEHEWSTETGIIGTIGQGITQTTAGDFVGAIGGPGSGSLANKITGASSIDKMLGSAANRLGARKPLIDPGYFQNYTGSQPRQFDMAFDLIPKNAEEANQILMIIYKLKQWSSPSKQISGVSLLAPYWFDIKMSNPYISSLAKIDRCVLTSMSIDYGADGAMQQTADGMPKYMTMNLRFQEADMTTADDYNTIPRAGS